MANVKAAEGVVVDSTGAVLVSKTATLKNASTGATITSGTTDANGKFSFTAQDETIRLRVDVAAGGASTQVYRRDPASLDLDHAYINTSLRSAAGATVALGGAVSMTALTATTGAFSSTVSMTALTATTGAFSGAVTMPSNGLNVGSGQLVVASGNVTATGEIQGATQIHAGPTTNAPAVANEAFIVQGDYTTGAVQFVINHANGTVPSGGVIASYRSRGTLASRSIVASGDNCLELIGRCWDGAAYLNTAFMEFVVDGTPGSNDMPGRIGFYTTADGASNVTERMRISSNGQVLVTGGGSAGVPDIGRISDTNTGIFWGAADFLQFTAGGNEVIKIAFSGSAQLSFFGGGTAAKQAPTGSRGGNAALASLLTALATYGLITDSTSA